jgi:hypothetical protein
MISMMAADSAVAAEFMFQAVGLSAASSSGWHLPNAKGETATKQKLVAPKSRRRRKVAKPVAPWLQGGRRTQRRGLNSDLIPPERRYGPKKFFSEIFAIFCSKPSVLPSTASFGSAQKPSNTIFPIVFPLSTSVCAFLRFSALRLSGWVCILGFTHRSVCQADFAYSMSLDLMKIIGLKLANNSVSNDIQKSAAQDRGLASRLDRWLSDHL